MGRNSAGGGGRGGRGGRSSRGGRAGRTGRGGPYQSTRNPRGRRSRDEKRSPFSGMQRNMRARYERISQRERQAGGAVGAQGKLVQALGPAEPGGVPERIEAVEFDAAQDAEALGIKPAAAAEPLVGRRAKGGRKKSGAGAGLPAADESEAVGAADQESEAANADEVDLEGVDGDVGEDDFDDEWDEDEDEEDEDEGEDKE